VKLTPKQQRLLDRMAAKASSLSGTFFRSVELRWMHPDEVISGAGTIKIGGRFALIGTRAVYASDSEETLAREISARKGRLGGKALISINSYPRITFRIDLTVDRHLSLVKAFHDRDLERLRQRCLNPASLGFSQLAGEHLQERGVQAVVYASVTGAGSNVVVFLKNTKPGQVVIFNRAKVLSQISRLSAS
jgi:RES domain-containing protein